MVLTDWLFDERERELIERHFDVLIPGNHLKSELIAQWGPGNYWWSGADQIVEYAASKSKKVRGHCLLWDGSSPWMVSGTRAQVKTKLEAHIAAVVGRFRDLWPGTVYAWDVVNEQCSGTRDGVNFFNRSNDPGNVDYNPWYHAYAQSGNGLDYMKDAFVATKLADPLVKTVFNDYGMELAGERLENYRDGVRYLLDNGTPIDGLGLQGHQDMTPEGKIVTLEGFENFFNLVRAIRADYEINIKAYITELDIGIYSGNTPDYGDNPPIERMRQQADQYKKLFDLFTENADILEEVSFWGVSDANSWRNTYPQEYGRRKDRPFMFDDQRRPKLCWEAIRPASP